MRLAGQLGVVVAGVMLACSAASAQARAGASAGVTPEGCAKLRLHGKKAEATACFTELSQSRDAYLSAEGFWGLGQWEDAKTQFEGAIKQPGAPAVWKARYGILLHERFNDVDSPPLFAQALEQDPKCAEALLGVAEIGAANFDDKAEKYLGQAIEDDPKLVEAHELLADLLLADSRPEDATREAQAAITLSPYDGAGPAGGGTDALDAEAVMAAAALLADKDAEADAWLAKIKAVNPGYGEGYAIVAKHMMLNRRYPEAIAYDRRAIEADPELWSARSDLGINLMRMGDEDEARQQLETAYNNGQTDAATANSLKLLDLYPKFVTTKDATTTLLLWNAEDALLQPYFEAWLHKAIAAYAAKYRMKLNGPVRVEVYPNHDDFAVRTTGMPGLGALGVTFGNTVAMDSPSGRKPGDFNWGATLWHEMSHVYILSMTKFRVPRWFTEGLAVHEEGQADPRWANRLTPEVVAAIRDKKLLKVEDLDQGFIYPKYPDQVIVSYWEGGTMCDYIAERWGSDALLGMAHSFGELKTLPEVFQENLKTTPAQFDTDYFAWLDKQWGATAKNFDQWREQLKALVEMKSDDEVIAAAPKVIALYPEYVEDANAYEMLAAAQLNQGNKQAAMDALKEYERRGGEDPKVLEKLAGLEQGLGQTKEAAETLEQLNFIYPEDEGLHRNLGTLLMAEGDNAGAVREFQAVLAMNPLDKAQAHYDVARAYLAAGDKAKAEESVLSSLEAAPNFKDAQKMLLELEGSK
ncbi:MAG TPA: tetratricopeptide repeat protein [Acidobacteriaceae bacterium]|nr:tetratricopeptide repeat protein [Acidobacteriaceae bacterium]